MDYLLELINSYLPGENYTRLVFPTLIGVATLAFCLSLMMIVNGLATPFRQRVRALVAHPEARVDQRKDSGRGWSAALDPLSRRLLPGKDWERSPVRAKLVHAGFRSDSAGQTFFAIKVLLALSSFTLALFVTRLFPQLEARQILLYAAGAAFVGLILPDMVLERLVRRRKRAIRNGFPDALDLLVVCVEAGLGLSAALQRVARELDVSHPELSEELNLVNVEIRAGVNRMDALRGLANRTGLDEIRGLVALLDQSVRFGSSIADTLRVYSEEFRDKRMQLAEEMAAKIGTKMIFPLTFFLWPGFFLIAVGPAVLKVLEALSR
jgi:tight adherence protein C